MKQIMEEIIFRHKSVSEMSRIYGIYISMLSILVRRTRLRGIESILHRNTRKAYPLSFKLEFVKRLEAGENLTALAAECNIENTVGKSWYMKYSEGGAKAILIE